MPAPRIARAFRGALALLGFPLRLMAEFLNFESTVSSRRVLLIGIAVAAVRRAAAHGEIAS